MKFLIVGLGNPGTEYQDTRHNIGFKTLDYIANESSVFFSTQRYGEVAEWKFKGRNITLLKPNTFMNLSGKAVRYWKDQLKVDLDKILIITDDIALPFGTLRIKGKGSAGGHNGLKDIALTLATEKYPRLRFGVGSDFGRGRQVEYVLGKWNKEESDLLTERMEKCFQAVKNFPFLSLGKLMSDFNNK